MGVWRRLQARILLKLGRFPSQRFSRYNGPMSLRYLGTWEKDVAMIIAEDLRKNGISIHIRGRGSMPRRLIGRTPYEAQCDCSTEFASHLALYLRKDPWEA